jgi:hypothetical protein
MIAVKIVFHVRADNAVNNVHYEHKQQVDYAIQVVILNKKI